MSIDPGGQANRRIEPFDPDLLETGVRQTAQAVCPGGLVDDLEIRHLIRVVTECALLLTDIYSDDRIARVMHPSRSPLSALVDSLIRERRDGEGEALYRVRRLPDDVRVVGDKALFDVGLMGLRRIKGYDLADLGPRAYRMAGEVLELLAEDRQLREFFKQNRLLMLPLEEEATFLRQCAERFPVYAHILSNLPYPLEARVRPLEDDLATRVPLMAAAAQALAEEPAVATLPSGAREDDAYAEAARRDAGTGAALSREEILSAYERMILFASIDIARLRSALAEVVVDQVEAIDALCDEFSLFASGTRDLSRPPAYFLVGPTGVGKNHLVESLRRLLEGIWSVDVPILTIEGPSYTYPSDINELRGATRGFIRSDEEGLLSAFHERSSRAPVSVILVDEVEKAHPQLRTFFLSILDRGTTTDNRGRVLNFSNSIVFFTSNLGYSDALRHAAPIGYRDDEARAETADRDVRRDVRRGLSPEFVNRLRMLHFRRLTRSSAERILSLEMERIARRYREVHGLDVELDPSARDELIRRGFSPAHGARRLSATLEAVLNVEISKKIRREDRRAPADRQELLAWLREVRRGGRAFDADETRHRVLGAVRANLDYGGIRVVFANGAFDYRPVGTPRD